MVASYLPIRIHPTPLVSVAIQQGKCVACPRVVDQSLQFHRWEQGDPTEPHRRGFQPLHPRIGWRRRSTCLSAIAWLRQSGMRLGYGGGFYDRLFAQYRAFVWAWVSMQSVDDWEAEAHDQRLDGFLSERADPVFLRPLVVTQSVFSLPRYSRYAGLSLSSQNG